MKARICLAIKGDFITDIYIEKNIPCILPNGSILSIHMDELWDLAKRCNKRLGVHYFNEEEDSFNSFPEVYTEDCIYIKESSIMSDEKGKLHLYIELTSNCVPQ